MLWPGPAIACDFSLLQHASPANKYLRTNFQEPPHLCFKSCLSSVVIGLKMALFRHMSNAASSDNDSAKSGAKFAGCLKKEHVACNINIKNKTRSIIRIQIKNNNFISEMQISIALASSLARSWGSKLHAVRTWRTIEGLADKGNSPGVEFPKQCRCCLWKVGSGVATTMAVIVWSVMLWYWIVGVPLVVASIGHCKKLYAVPQTLQKKISKLPKYVQIYYYHIQLIHFYVSLIIAC